MVFDDEFAAGLPDRDGDGLSDAGSDSCSQSCKISSQSVSQKIQKIEKKIKFLSNRNYKVLKFCFLVKISKIANFIQNLYFLKIFLKISKFDNFIPNLNFLEIA